MTHELERQKHLEKVHLRKLGKRADRLIKIPLWIVTGLGMLTLGQFLWDSVKQHEDIFLSNEDLIWKVAIIAYFTSWVVGVQKDKTQELDVYLSAPRSGRIDPGSAASCVLVFILFALMWLSESASHDRAQLGGIFFKAIPGASATADFFAVRGMLSFVVFLNVLWILNVFLWRLFIRKFIAPMSQRSRELYAQENNYVGLLKTELFDGYIMGSWQVHRFLVGGLYLAVLDGGFWLAGLERHSLWMSVLVAGFVIAIEGWIWLMRYKLDFSLSCIDDISARYDFLPSGQ